MRRDSSVRDGWPGWRAGIFLFTTTYRTALPATEHPFHWGGGGGGWILRVSLYGLQAVSSGDGCISLFPDLAPNTLTVEMWTPASSSEFVPHSELDPFRGVRHTVHSMTQVTTHIFIHHTEEFLPFRHWGRSKGPKGVWMKNKKLW